MEQRVTTYSQYAISSNVNGIKDMEAQTLDGLSVQKIYFQPDVNLDLAISQIVSATNAIRSLMPSGVQPPIVVQFNASSVPVLPVSLSSDKRSTKIAQSAAAALRLLLFTWCRLREILHLRWEHVDVERSCLFLPDSKSGRKTVILNAPALAVLNGLERNGPYVVPGVDPEQPRHDLKRPWDAVTKRAGVTGWTNRDRARRQEDRLSYSTYQKANCIIEYCCITLNVERRCYAPRHCVMGATDSAR
jgi:hypothetical protein